MLSRCSIVGCADDKMEYGRLCRDREQPRRIGRQEKAVWPGRVRRRCRLGWHSLLVRVFKERGRRIVNPSTTNGRLFIIQPQVAKNNKKMRRLNSRLQPFQSCDYPG